MNSESLARAIQDLLSCQISRPCFDDYGSSEAASKLQSELESLKSAVYLLHDTVQVMLNYLQAMIEVSNSKQG